MRRKDGWYLILLPCKDAHKLNRFVPGRSEFRRRKSNHKEISLINPKPIGCAAETIQISAAWLSARWVIYSGVDIRTKYIKRRLPDFKLLLLSIINSSFSCPSATGLNSSLYMVWYMQYRTVLSPLSPSCLDPLHQITRHGQSNHFVFRTVRCGSTGFSAAPEYYHTQYQPIPVHTQLDIPSFCILMLVEEASIHATWLCFAMKRGK